MRRTQRRPGPELRSLALIFAPLLMLVLLLAVTSAMIGASREELTGARRSVDTAIASGAVNIVQHPDECLGERGCAGGVPEGIGCICLSRSPQLQQGSDGAAAEGEPFTSTSTQPLAEMG
jgi:hypothetical protein